MNIKLVRAKTNLSQTKFSEKYNIPIRTIQDWEAGLRTPPEYVMDMLTYIVADENVNHTAWIFYEYRDRAGTGSYKLFKDKDAAIEYAKGEWLSMCEQDQHSYLSNSNGQYWVAELPVTWNDISEAFDPDFSEYTPIWDAIAEFKGQGAK